MYLRSVFKHSVSTSLTYMSCQPLLCLAWITVPYQVIKCHCWKKILTMKHIIFDRQSSFHLCVSSLTSGDWKLKDCFYLQSDVKRFWNQFPKACIPDILTKFLIFLHRPWNLWAKKVWVQILVLCKMHHCPRNCQSIRNCLWWKNYCHGIPKDVILIRQPHHYFGTLAKMEFEKTICQEQ